MEQIIDALSKKNGFLQDADIENVEKCDFSSANYRAIDGKIYVSVLVSADEEYYLECGKINIIIETIDDEEWYYIDKNQIFIIDLDEENCVDNLEKLLRQYEIIN